MQVTGVVPKLRFGHGDPPLHKGFTKLGAQKQDICQLVGENVFFCVSTYARVQFASGVL